MCILLQLKKIRDMGLAHPNLFLYNSETYLH